ncbi:aldo/keto reductase [Chloroflexota bacterium]
MTAQMQIPLRRLGKTEIEVSAIGLGVMQFAGGGKGLIGKAFPNLEDKDGIIKTALDGGINWFDTAEMYGFGRSEQGLAAALKAAGKQSDEVIVATKWLPLFRTARNIPKSIDNRIRFLDGYAIDVYMVHQPWGFSSPESEMEAMADLVEAGKIRSVGVSNFDAARMPRAYEALKKRGLPLAVNQMSYSLIDRRIETNGVLDAAKELGVTIIAYTPIGYGLLTGKYHKNPQLLEKAVFHERRRIARNLEPVRPLVQALEEIGTKYGAAPVQVALNWLITFQGESVVAIPGATKAQHAEQSAGAMNFRMTDEEISRLDELSRQFR